MPCETQVSWLICCDTEHLQSQRLGWRVCDVTERYAGKVQNKWTTRKFYL